MKTCEYAFKRGVVYLWLRVRVPKSERYVFIEKTSETKVATCVQRESSFQVPEMKNLMY